MADKLRSAKDKKLNNSAAEHTQKDKKSFLASVAETLSWVGGTAVEVGGAAAKQTHNLIEQSTQNTGRFIDYLRQSTQNTGRFIDYLSQNWLIRKLSGVLNLNWLIGASENVDLAKAQETVDKLKQQYPQESPSQISHRIMVEKATQAGGIGLATSVLPGVAAALLAIDLAATTKLQSEMLYQIAAAYGLDLKDPARRGEVLAIFGLALGGGRLLKAAGLGLLRNVPFAGAAIAVSSNATMIYSLGYAACRFYEAKLDESTSLTSKETLANLKQQSENYLETAIAQEAIMDEVLVHMILASHPDKTWEEIRPELQAINLSEHSLKQISENIKSPQPLDSLLNQLNRDFAIPLLVQCQKIAEINGETTELEQNIMTAIANKFDIGQ